MPGVAVLEEARERSRSRPVESRSNKVVAVVLADGSVREVGADWSDHREGGGDWASGSVAGNGWVLWWERRSFDRLRGLT